MIFRQLWKYIRGESKEEYEYLYYKDGWLYSKAKSDKIGTIFNTKTLKMDLDSLKEYLNTEEGKRKNGISND